MVQRRPDHDPKSASGRPARGMFGSMERNSLRGPGYCRTDVSFFKHIAIGGTRELEVRNALRIESRPGKKDR